MTKPKAPYSLTDDVIHNDRLQIRTVGLGYHLFDDLYHRSVRASWTQLFAGFGVLFLGINAVFAGLYLADPGGLVGDNGGTMAPFLRAFFFSVHTIATVGYGNVVPHSAWANWVVVIEIACGILLIAITSGLMFARFSRPSARILFSAVVVVRPFEGVPTLMFRAANQRLNFILEAGVRLSIVREEMLDGQKMRRFHDLKLERPSNPIFALTWLVMHKIDADSPLFGLDLAQPGTRDDELIVVLSGIDSSMSQMIHARHAYTLQAIRWGHGFADIISLDAQGRRRIDYGSFHDTYPLAQADV